MFEKQLLKKSHRMTIYEKKPGTIASFYWVEGDIILPNRLSITKDQVARVERADRNILHPVAGQLLGKFRKKEISPLKSQAPYMCHTQIWKHPDFSDFVGYGSIGISNECGKIDRDSDTQDLVVLDHDDGEWDKIRINYFPSMILRLDEVLAYLSKRGKLTLNLKRNG
jgi:hypothetical protein